MSAEDVQADEAVARGRNAGGVWIVTSVLAFGCGLLARSLGAFVVAWSTGAVLFSIGLVVRARYWQAARRRLGDATIQRARWRSMEADDDRPLRIAAAVLIVLVLLGLELWT
ncbi:MAG: hypothetical protein R8G01_22745 [Ilumatobacteraceae bacterium]|nr:hypothetical protein [Ilumatobacteraceae bacterium]